MNEIIIDTNFIITCIKEKIEIQNSLEELFGKYKMIVANEVIDELKKISDDKKVKKSDRELAQISIKVLDNFSDKINFNTPDVDKGIIEYVKDKNNLYVATLDRELIKRLKKKNTNVKILKLVKSKKKIIIKE